MTDDRPTFWQMLGMGALALAGLTVVGLWILCLLAIHAAIPILLVLCGLRYLGWI